MTVSAQKLIDDLVEGRGGLARFNDVQVQIARSIVSLMFDIQVAPIGERTKIASTMVALMGLLPKPARDATARLPEINSSMTVREAALLYQAHLRANDLTDSDIDAIVAKLERLRSEGQPIAASTVGAEFYRQQACADEDEEPAPDPMPSAPPREAALKPSPSIAILPPPVGKDAPMATPSDASGRLPDPSSVVVSRPAVGDGNDVGFHQDRGQSRFGTRGRGICATEQQLPPSALGSAPFPK